MCVVWGRLGALHGAWRWRAPGAGPGRCGGGAACASPEAAGSAQTAQRDRKGSSAEVRLAPAVAQSCGLPAGWTHSPSRTAREAFWCRTNGSSGADCRGSPTEGGREGVLLPCHRHSCPPSRKGAVVAAVASLRQSLFAPHRGSPSVPRRAGRGFARRPHSGRERRMRALAGLPSPAGVSVGLGKGEGERKRERGSVGRRESRANLARAGEREEAANKSEIKGLGGGSPSPSSAPFSFSLPFSPSRVRRGCFASLHVSPASFPSSFLPARERKEKGAAERASEQQQQQPATAAAPRQERARGRPVSPAPSLSAGQGQPSPLPSLFGSPG